MCIPVFRCCLDTSCKYCTRTAYNQTCQNRKPHPFQKISRVLSDSFIIILYYYFCIMRMFSFSHLRIFCIFFFFHLYFPSCISLLFRTLITFLCSDRIPCLIYYKMIFLTMQHRKKDGFLTFERFLFVVPNHPLNQLFFTSALSFHSFYTVSSFVFTLLDSLSSLNLS